MPETRELPRQKAFLPLRIAGRLLRAARAVYWRQALAEFGHGSSIARPSLVVGGRSIAIGPSVTIWSGARLEALGEESDGIVLRIGAGTVIQPGVHIGAVQCVSIGQGVLMASAVYITDHDHDFSDPFDPVVSNRRVQVAPVHVGDYVWLGERAIVLKGVTIGERSIVAAGSVVTSAVPPFSIVAGAPARVIRCYDHESRTWIRR